MSENTDRSKPMSAHDWQPIDTAPEDGTVILAYRPDAGVFTAHYVEEDAHLSNAMNPPEGDFYWFTTSGEDLTGDMFTHWMSLPNPPSHTPTSQEREPSATSHAATSPGPVNCNIRLRFHKQTYPRTCERCRLGTCPFFHEDGASK